MLLVAVIHHTIYSLTFVAVEGLVFEITEDPAVVVCLIIDIPTFAVMEFCK